MMKVEIMFLDNFLSLHILVDMVVIQLPSAVMYYHELTLLYETLMNGKKYLNTL